MDSDDPSAFLSELQTVDDDDGQVYYTILQNNEEQEEQANYSLKTEDQHDYLDSDNVFYLSLTNDELEETETTEIQEESSTAEIEEQTEEPNVNMEYLEQVTLPNGTQAYMARYMSDTQEEDNLFAQNEDAFDNPATTTMLFENITEEDLDVKIDPNVEKDCNNLEEDSTFEDGITLSQDFDEDIDVSKYEQIELEDGSVAIIEIGLYNKILEQSKSKIALANSKTKEKEIVPSASRATFKCSSEGCDKSYKTMHHLRVHMRIHTGTRPYVCRVEGCDKTFATGYSLKAHSRTHTGEKPYTCQVCEKGFKTSGDLQKHNRIHTGEKPFMCPIEGCGRSFTTSNIRKVHVRSHTGERPYECPEPGCNKAFASATNYKNHVRIHSGEKPYACTFESCGKRFTEYSSLYKHQIVHSNNKSCRCEYCGRVCRHQASLIAHKKTVHNIIVTDNGTEIMVKMIDEEEEEEEEEATGMAELNPQIFFVTQ